MNTQSQRPQEQIIFPPTLFTNEQALFAHQQLSLMNSMKQITQQKPTGGNWDIRHKTKLSRKAMNVLLICSTFFIYFLTILIAFLFTRNNGLVLSIGAIGSIPALYIIHKFLTRRIEKRSIPTKDWLFIIASIGSLWWLTQMVHRLAYYSETGKPFVDNYSQYGPIYVLIFTVIAGPVVEELIFRGIMLKALTTMVNPFVAVVISTILFASLHPGFPLFTVVLGIGLAYITLYTGRIRYGIIIHMVVNFIAYLNMHGISFFISGSVFGTHHAKGIGMIFLIISLGGIIAMLFAYKTVWRLRLKATDGV